MDGLLLTFNTLSLNHYHVIFENTDQHTVDMIAWTLKELEIYKSIVEFVATKKIGFGKTNIQMNILLKKVCDVPQLISNASRCAAQSVNLIKNEFDQALKK